MFSQNWAKVSDYQTDYGTVGPSLTNSEILSIRHKQKSIQQLNMYKGICLLVWFVFITLFREKPHSVDQCKKTRIYWFLRSSITKMVISLLERLYMHFNIHKKENNKFPKLKHYTMYNVSEASVYSHQYVLH